MSSCIFSSNAADHKKQFNYGTQRTHSPEATLLKIKPLLKEFGISRVADITGLDNLKIPVAIAIQPQSKSICISSGKGLTHTQAFVSASMEAIENFHAENIVHERFTATYSQLSMQYEMIPADELPLRKYSVFHEDLPIEWIMGRNVINEAAVPIPFEMLTMDFSYPLEKNCFACFQSGTNGLASGNSLLEAVLSAIYELIERDAISLRKLKYYYPLPRLVNVASIPFDSISKLYNLLIDQQTELFIYDYTVDNMVPTFAAILISKIACPAGNFLGYGTHLDPEIALIRAITEAAQTRCVYISGSRDDIFMHDLLFIKEHSYKSGTNEKFLSYSQLNVINKSHSTSFLEDYYYLITLLKNIGIKQLICVDLTNPIFKIPVVKMFVPYMEGYPSEIYTPGKRARGMSKTNIQNSNELSFIGIHAPARKGY